MEFIDIYEQLVDDYANNERKQFEEHLEDLSQDDIEAFCKLWVEDYFDCACQGEADESLVDQKSKELIEFVNNDKSKIITWAFDGEGPALGDEE